MERRESVLDVDFGRKGDRLERREQARLCKGWEFSVEQPTPRYVLKQVLPAYAGDRFAMVDPQLGQNMCSTGGGEGISVDNSGKN